MACHMAPPLTIEQAIEANWIEIVGTGSAYYLDAKSVDGSSFQIDIPETLAMTADEEGTSGGIGSTLSWMQNLGENPDLLLEDVWEYRAYGADSNSRELASVFGERRELFSMQDEIIAKRLADGSNLVYLAHQQKDDGYRRVVMKEDFEIRAFDGPNADRAAMEFATQGSDGKLIVALGAAISGTYEQLRSYQDAIYAIHSNSALDDGALAEYDRIAHVGSAGTILAGLQLTAGDLLANPRNIEIVDRQLKPYFEMPELGYRYMIGPNASSGSYSGAVSYEQPPIDGSTFPTSPGFSDDLGGTEGRADVQGPEGWHTSIMRSFSKIRVERFLPVAFGVMKNAVGLGQGTDAIARNLALAADFETAINEDLIGASESVTDDEKIELRYFFNSQEYYSITITALEIDVRHYAFSEGVWDLMDLTVIVRS